MPWQDPFFKGPSNYIGKILDDGFHWVSGPIQSLSRNVGMSVCCATFCVFLKCITSPIYKCCKSNRSIEKRFLWEKLRKEIGLRHSLLMDVGHNQQQHHNVNSGGVVRVPCRSHVDTFCRQFKKNCWQFLCTPFGWHFFVNNIDLYVHIFIYIFWPPPPN